MMISLHLFTLTQPQPIPNPPSIVLEEELAAVVRGTVAGQRQTLRAGRGRAAWQLPQQLHTAASGAW